MKTALKEGPSKSVTYEARALDLGVWPCNCYVQPLVTLNRQKEFSQRRNEVYLTILQHVGLEMLTRLSVQLYFNATFQDFAADF